MKYYVAFRNGKLASFWERENLETEPHPSYIKKEDIHEVTLEQYENARFLSLVDNNVVFDSTGYDESRMNVVRGSRDSKLTASDFVMLSDSQATEACKTAYETYRQSLRNLPSVVDLDEIVYPTEPTYETN